MFPIGNYERKGANMTGQPFRLSSVCSLLILIPLLAACQNEKQYGGLPYEEKPGQSAQQADTVDASNNAYDLDASNAEHITDSASTGNAADTVQPEADVSSTVDPEPRLLGFSLGDPMEAVAEKFGKAIEQYTMEEDSTVIVVHNYPGFTIGFDSKRSVYFIDVYAPDIDPELQGLTIGSSVSEAIRKLGTPDVQTTAVIMYEFEEAVLKLDIDPSADRIVSFKLFTTTRQ